MKLLDGKKVAANWQRQLRGKKAPGSLEAILIGNNPASVLYLKKKAEMAKALGVHFHLHRFSAKAAPGAITRQIERLNANNKVAGIIVQLPLPARFNVAKIVNAVVPYKDIDGLTDTNIISSKTLPATAVGILKLLRAYKITTRRKKIVLLGFTRLLNVPLSIYLARQGSEVVVLQQGTKDMRELKAADIIISAVGQPKLVKGRLVKKGAVVIDAGVSYIGKRVVGDIDTRSVNKKAKYLTPVPGGVGPMTVISLFANLTGMSKVSSRG